ncbi:MAG: hypothetical protein JW720_12630 [Sedimentisphaerales bacterium]|nr:hypothetical protein [Sedimentisphaerales bacterium]
MKRFRVKELLVIIAVITVVTAAGASLLRSNIDAAKWSEGRAIAGTLARAMRTYVAANGISSETNPTLAELGIEADELDGTYFTGGESGRGDFSWVVISCDPLDYLITVKAPPEIRTPSRMTLNASGNWGVIH